MTTQFAEEHPNLPRKVEEHPNVAGRDRTRSVHVPATMTMEALGAAAAVVLAIIGLAGILPDAMMTIATIVLGATFLIDAGAVGARHGALARSAVEHGSVEAYARAPSGLSAEAGAGLAGIALGILALLGLSPLTLSTVGLIVFGGALLLGSGAKDRFVSTATAHSGLAEDAHHAIRGPGGFSSGGEVLVGIGAVVLGILALIGVHNVQPGTLVLIGFLAVGLAMLLSGSARGARTLVATRHEA